MSDPEFSSGAGFGSSAGNAALRGGLLVLLAVLLGFLLLNRSDDGDDLVAPGVDGPASVTTTTVPDGAGSTVSTLPTQTVPTTLGEVRATEVVRVLVLNGAQVSRAAGVVTSDLNAEFYITLDPSNVTQPEEAIADSYVVHAEGYAAEARALAEVVGADPARSRPMPLDVETDSVEVDRADLILVLGRDVAGS